MSIAALFFRESAAEEAFDKGFYGGIFEKLDHLGEELVLMQLASGEIPTQERPHAYEWLRRRHAAKRWSERWRGNLTFALSVIAVAISVATFALRVL